MPFAIVGELKIAPCYNFGHFSSDLHLRVGYSEGSTNFDFWFLSFEAHIAFLFRANTSDQYSSFFKRAWGLLLLLFQVLVDLQAARF